MRENGFLIISPESKIKEKKKEGANYGFWILKDNEEYYFKVGTKYSIYMELFCEEIAKILNIPTVSYDLAKVGDFKGVISKNYNPDHVKETSLFEILDLYYENVICKSPDLYENEVFIENAFNLEDVWWALDYYYKDYPNKDQIVKKLMDQLVDSFLLQILTFNADLSYENMQILNTPVPSLTPNFDYGFAGIVDFEVKANKYFFPVVPYTMGRPKQSNEIIIDFINMSDEVYIQKFEKYLSTLYQTPINDILKKIEDKIGVSLEEDIKEYLTADYKKKLYYIGSLLKENKKTRK